MHACVAGHTEVAEALLDAGASPMVKVRDISVGLF